MTKNLLDLCEESLPSLQYHCFNEFTQKAVHLCSNSARSPKMDEHIISKSQCIFLQLICHHVDKVRVMAYRTSLDIIKVSSIKYPISSSTELVLYATKDTKWMNI